MTLFCVGLLRSYDCDKLLACTATFGVRTLILETQVLYVQLGQVH
jgi:hypothetical protein